MTIRSVLIINNHGKARLSKFYSPLSSKRQQELIRLIFTLVSIREQTHNPNGNSDSLVCNFLDAPELTPLLPPSSHAVNFKSNKSSKSNYKSSTNDDELRVIYRHYATLYFVFVADTSESELGILDLIQVSPREDKDSSRDRYEPGRALFNPPWIRRNLLDIFELGSKISREKERDNSITMRRGTRRTTTFLQSCIFYQGMLQIIDSRETDLVEFCLFLSKSRSREDSSVFPNLLLFSLGESNLCAFLLFFCLITCSIHIYFYRSPSSLPLLSSQVFVESLDRCFENVCELDLIFHFDEVSFFFLRFSSPSTLPFIFFC